MRNATGVGRKENIRKGHGTVEKEKEQWKFTKNTGMKRKKQRKGKAMKRIDTRQWEEQQEMREREISREGKNSGKRDNRGNEERK
jgi:hypothetical protein